MITAETKLEIIDEMIWNYMNDQGPHKPPKEQIAFMSKIKEIIYMEGRNDNTTD